MTADKECIPVENGLMLVDTRSQGFDMRDIQNRRFMYSPKTGALILGPQHAEGKMIAGSHAEEHGNSGTKEPFDSFIRGWVGTGRGYKNGVIHFAPPIDGKNTVFFNRAFDTLLMLRENGANDKTVVRGFGKAWEQPLSKALGGGDSPGRGEKPSVRAQLKATPSKREPKPKTTVRPDMEL